MLDLGFRLKRVRDGVAKEVEFAELLQRRTIVSVYMKNNTPSCDRQNDSLGEHVAALNAAGYDVIALSRDSCGSHLRYAAAKTIHYTLVSDPTDAFARAANSLVQKAMYGRTFIGPARAAFVLDREGRVLAVVEKVDPAAHGEQLKKLVKDL